MLWEKMSKISDAFRMWRLPSINGTPGTASSNLWLNKVLNITLHLK